MEFHGPTASHSMHLEHELTAWRWKESHPLAVLEGRASHRTRVMGSFHFVFSLNSILKSFSVDLPHRDKLDFCFLWRENKVIYLILHLSLS